MLNSWISISGFGKIILFPCDTWIHLCLDMLKQVIVLTLHVLILNEFCLRYSTVNFDNWVQISIYGPNVKWAAYAYDDISKQLKTFKH